MARGAHTGGRDREGAHTVSMPLVRWVSTTRWWSSCTRSMAAARIASSGLRSGQPSTRCSVRSAHSMTARVDAQDQVLDEHALVDPVGVWRPFGHHELERGDRRGRRRRAPRDACESIVASSCCLRAVLGEEHLERALGFEAHPGTGLGDPLGEDAATLGADGVAGAARVVAVDGRLGVTCGDQPFGLFVHLALGPRPDVVDHAVRQVTDQLVWCPAIDAEQGEDDHGTRGTSGHGS